MTRAPSSRGGHAPPHRSGVDQPIGVAPLYAALDLGTNNCRLMIASLNHSSFRIVEAFSRIVRLGEGIGQSGALSEAAMDRTLKALHICADKIARRNVSHVRAVATQACRVAANGIDFIRRVETETGLKLSIITPEEEARLAVIGCASLLDGWPDAPQPQAAAVVDVGGGSTELSWVELGGNLIPPGHGLRLTRKLPRPAHWISVPVGVVTLAERFPEPDHADRKEWFEAMVRHVMSLLSGCRLPDTIAGHFDRGHAYIVGTSGAITSLAGVHLGLDRYERSRVDGLWMRKAEVEATTQRLLSVDRAAREFEPCIGRDRADLVLAGAAILEAVQRLWPCERLRVADRGLREGLLLSMVRKRSRRRRRPQKAA